jgi:hypothetical protein
MKNWKELEEYNENTNGLKIAYRELDNQWFVFYLDKEYQFDSEPEMDVFLENIFDENDLSEGAINYL